MNLEELTVAENRLIQLYRSMNRDSKKLLIAMAEGFGGSVLCQARYALKDGIAYINTDPRQDEPQP